jgi:DNA-binding NarL/FixJ family response regulator
MATPLTSRETQVLALLAEGKSTDAIADAFGIAERTARAHLQMIVAKLGASDGAQAVAIALRAGLIKR